MEEKGRKLEQDPDVRGGQQLLRAERQNRGGRGKKMKISSIRKP